VNDEIHNCTLTTESRCRNDTEVRNLALYRSWEWREGNLWGPHEVVRLRGERRSNGAKRIPAARQVKRSEVCDDANTPTTKGSGVGTYPDWTAEGRCRKPTHARSDYLACQ